MKISRKRKLYAIIVIVFLMILFIQIKKECSKQINQEKFQITEEPDPVVLDSEEATEDSKKNYNFQRIMEKDYSCLDCDEIVELKALIRNSYYEWKFCDVNGDDTEELILCEKQENPGEDIRCIIGIFVETSDGVKCVFWHTGDGSEFYSFINGEFMYYEDAYEIVRYASYSVCCFNAAWEIKKDRQFEIIQIDNWKLYDEYVRNAEWFEDKKTGIEGEGEFFRCTMYEEDGKPSTVMMLSENEWMDQFKENLMEYESVESILERGFYISIRNREKAQEDEFCKIMEGDDSSLYEFDEKESGVLKQIAEDGRHEWNLCDVNGDGENELILQIRQGEMEGDIQYMTGLFVKTEKGVKKVLWDIFESGEFYSFIDGNIIYYYYVRGTHAADTYARCSLDDEYGIRMDKLFQIIDVNSQEAYDGLLDEVKKDITGTGLYYRYIDYEENGEKKTMLLSEDEWRTKFKEEIGEYGRVSARMHGFAPFDIYVGVDN